MSIDYKFTIVFFFCLSCNNFLDEIKSFCHSFAYGFHKPGMQVRLWF